MRTKQPDLNSYSMEKEAQVRAFYEMLDVTTDQPLPRRRLRSALRHLWLASTSGLVRVVHRFRWSVGDHATQYSSDDVRTSSHNRREQSTPPSSASSESSLSERIQVVELEAHSHPSTRQRRRVWRRNTDKVRQRATTMWQSRPIRWTRRSAIIAAAGLIAANTAEPLLAMYYKDSHVTADALARPAGGWVGDPTDRSLFVRPANADPSSPSRAHTTAVERTGQPYVNATTMVVGVEDERLLANKLSLAGFLRVNGTDLIGISRAVVDQLMGEEGGGSTLPVMTCSITLGTMKMSEGFFQNIWNKGREHICAIRVEAESGSDPATMAAHVLDNAPVVIGGPNSNFGAEVEGVQLGARVLFRKNFSSIKDCEQAFLVATINAPFIVPGRTHSSKKRAERRMVRNARRAALALSKLRESQGRLIDEDDKACLAKLPNLLRRKFRNPSTDVYQAFGDAAEEVRNELTAMKAANPTIVEVRAAFKPDTNARAMRMVSAAACRVDRRRSLLKNICEEDGALTGVQIRVHAMRRDGMLVRSVSLGEGATTSLTEVDNGSLPSRGSIMKGLLLPLTRDGDFCRFDYPGLEDPDGVKGLDHRCKPGEDLDSAFVVRRSINQATLYAIEEADQKELVRFLRELEVPVPSRLRDIVLGYHPPATRTLMRAYAAITNFELTAVMPHFLDGAVAERIDLRKMLNREDVTRVRRLLSAPTQPGGTAHAMAVRMGEAGYQVSLAKTGSSEAGNGTDERGKHIIAEVIDRSGQPLIIFAEIASSDATAIARSRGLSTADLAEIIIAALED